VRREAKVFISLERCDCATSDTAILIHCTPLMGVRDSYICFHH
jgi:hypothetical protein